MGGGDILVLGIGSSCGRASALINDTSYAADSLDRERRHSRNTSGQRFGQQTPRKWCLIVREVPHRQCLLQMLRESFTAAIKRRTGSGRLH